MYTQICVCVKLLHHARQFFSLSRFTQKPYGNNILYFIKLGYSMESISRHLTYNIFYWATSKRVTSVLVRETWKPSGFNQQFSYSHVLYIGHLCCMISTYFHVATLACLPSACNAHCTIYFFNRFHSISQINYKAKRHIDLFISFLPIKFETIFTSLMYTWS